MVDYGKILNLKNKMKYKIVVDSSSNLYSDYIKDENIGFDVIPLTLIVEDNVFVDDDNINTNELLKTLNESNKKPQSSCPSPYEFHKSFQDAENIFVITISSKLSGCYNVANLVAKSFENKNIYVIDSKGTAGTMILLVDKIYELIKKELSFAEIIKQIEEYKNTLNLLFVLNKFDNLVKNGRVKKTIALIAKALIIKPLCIASDGDIKIYEKVRTYKGVLKRLVLTIGKLTKDFSNKTCIICYTQNKDDAISLQKEIQQFYKFKEIKILENKGLCSFYALEKGVIVSF